jgi:hypothetical protein
MKKTPTQATPKPKKRLIYCPGPDKWLTIGQYVSIIRRVKEKPLETVYPQTFTRWFSGTGADMMREFRDGIMDRINRGIPYYGVK